jgi:16S rRNA U516 pseudouridylate synthase RsuA-like enzyme
MAEELEHYKREAVIAEAAKDLADTQAEKLKSLAEGVDFDDEETFAQKVNTIKESYFNKKATGGEEEILDEEDAYEVASDEGSMSSYLSAIKKTSK